MFPYSDICVTQISNFVEIKISFYGFCVTQISNFVEIKISFFGNDQWALGWDNGHWDGYGNGH